MRRRQLLTASAIAVAGLAGCSGGSDSESTEDGDSGSGGGDDLGSPSSTVQTFYGTLYGEDDIEATNELYHPESEAPELKPADFEDFGGVESIDSDIENTEVVSQEDGRARVHVDVAYSTPVGSATLSTASSRNSGRPYVGTTTLTRGSESTVPFTTTELSGSVFVIVRFPPLARAAVDSRQGGGR